MNKKWIIGLVALGLIVVVLWLGSRVAQQVTATQTPQPGETVTAFIGDLSASATASGQVQARRRATLSVDTPGRVTEVYIRLGDSVTAGELLMQLDTAVLETNLATAEQNLRLKEAALADLLQPANELDIAAAEAALASAQANLADLQAGPSEIQVTAYEATVRVSEASLASASANLASAQDSVKDSQITAAQAALTSAQLQQEIAQETNANNPTEQTHQALLQANQTVADAQAQLDALLAGPDTAAAASSVAAASARLEGAEANFSLQNSGAGAAQLAAAEAQVAQAEASLADLLAGPTAEEIAIAEAEVTQAQLARQDAEEALAAAALTAPFAGVVTAVNFSQGEFASGPAIELVDSDSLAVVLEVDEVDVGQLQTGQPARLTLEAWPETPIDGQITTITPQARTQPGSSLVIYEVHLSLGETSLPVRVGMTANANLITAEFRDVLLVPNQAINADRETGTYTVNLVNGGEIEVVTVTIGQRDNQNTQITSGLQAGDELRISNSAPIGNIFEPGNP